MINKLEAIVRLVECKKEYIKLMDGPDHSPMLNVSRVRVLNEIKKVDDQISNISEGNYDEE